MGGEMTMALADMLSGVYLAKGPATTDDVKPL